MENPRPAKVAVVNEVKDRLSSSGGAILTEYRGLNVGDLATLRRSLREAGGEQQGGPVDVDSPPAEAEAETEAEAEVQIPDHPGVSPAPDETENPPDFEGESPPSDAELPESPAPDETAKPPEAEMTEPPA